MERAVVHGVHTSPPAAKITIGGVPHTAAVAAVFRLLADHDVRPGLATQYQGDPTTITVTVPRAEGAPLLAALHTARPGIGHQQVRVEDIVVLTLTGAGLRTDPAVPATFCEVLARGGVRLTLVTIENGRISAACGETEAEAAVRALCEAFEVGADDAALSSWVRPAIGR